MSWAFWECPGDNCRYRGNGQGVQDIYFVSHVTQWYNGLGVQLTPSRGSAFSCTPSQQQETTYQLLNHPQIKWYNAVSNAPVVVALHIAVDVSSYLHGDAAARRRCDVEEAQKTVHEHGVYHVPNVH